MVVNACKSDHGGLSKTLPPPSLPSSPASFLPSRQGSGGGWVMASRARSAFPAPPPQFWLCSSWWRAGGGCSSRACASLSARREEERRQRPEANAEGLAFLLRASACVWRGHASMLPAACAAWPAHPALKRGWGELYWTGSEEGALFRVHLPLDGVNRAVGGIPRIPFLFVCLFKLFDPVVKV